MNEETIRENSSRLNDDLNKFVAEFHKFAKLEGRTKTRDLAIEFISLKLVKLEKKIDYLLSESAARNPSF